MRGVVVLGGLAAIVAVAGVVAFARELPAQPCPGYSEPIAAPELLEQAWTLPLVARPRVVADKTSTTFMVSYPTSGTTLFELGPFLARRDWQQGGNDAHTLGPPHVRLSLAPKEGSWGPAHAGVLDAYEYHPVELELRDGGDGRYVLVVINAIHPSGATEPRGQLLPRRPPSAGPHSVDQNRGFVFRVVQHPGGHRFAHGAHLVAALVALGAGALALVLSRERNGRAHAEGHSARHQVLHVAAAFALALASLLIALTWV